MQHAWRSIDVAQQFPVQIKKWWRTLQNGIFPTSTFERDFLKSVAEAEVTLLSRAGSNVA